MKLVVCLGNPGKEYENTRHNIGFLFSQYMQKKHNFKIDKKEKKALTGTLNIENEKVMFALPQTFMNLSGEAVQELKNFYKLDNKDIIIIYDDIDLEFGKVRFRENGSAGTHNGMRNIVNLCNGQTIPRIRIGIGRPQNANITLMDFVLSRFSAGELDSLNNSFEEAEKILIKYLKD